MSVQYFKIDNYSMKCRLYPNKTQAEKLDMWFHGVHAFHNMLLHDMMENNLYTNEEKDEKDNEKTIHYPNFSKGVEAKSLNKYRERNQCVALVPGGALSANIGLKHDLQKAQEATGNSPIEQWGEKYINENGEKITKGVKFYSKAHPRTSMSYQIRVSNIKFYKDEKENDRKVISIGLSSDKDKIGDVKIRGWNQNIRFDVSCEMGFKEWVNTHKKDKIQIKLKKDNCGDYWIVFVLNNVYKPMPVPDEKQEWTGIDVGEKTLATLADGTKFDNVFDYYVKMNKKLDLRKEQETLKHYNKKLSRSNGWKNEKFRDERTQNKELQPSKTYKQYELKSNKLNRDIQRKRKNYYHKVTAFISTQYDNVGIEGLRVKDMQYKKEKKDDRKKNNKQSKKKT